MKIFHKKVKGINILVIHNTYLDIRIYSKICKTGSYQSDSEPSIHGLDVEESCIINSHSIHNGIVESLLVTVR